MFGAAGGVVDLTATVEAAVLHTLHTKTHTLLSQFALFFHSDLLNAAAALMPFRIMLALPAQNS